MSRPQKADRPADEQRSPWKNRQFRLTVFRRAMVSVSVALLLSAMAEGIWQNHIYFVYVACAGLLMLLFSLL